MSWPALLRGQRDRDDRNQHLKTRVHAGTRRAPGRQQCNRGRVKEPPERGTAILWLPAGLRARQQQSQPRRQLRGRRTTGEPPKRLGNRLVGNADALGDEAVRVAKVTKPGGAWRYPAVHRSGLDPAEDELPANASAGANAIVAGPPCLSLTESTVYGRPRGLPKRRSARPRRSVVRKLDHQAQRRQNLRNRTMGEIRASVTLENSWDRENVDRGVSVQADVRRTIVEGIVGHRRGESGDTRRDRAGSWGSASGEQGPSSTQTNGGKSAR